MAYNTSLAAILFISSILLAMSGDALAARIISQNSKPVDMKHPEWFIGSDGSYLIPGLGRLPYKPKLGNGKIWGNPIGGSTGDYIPGADDTNIPNPGFEVPNPAGGGNIPPP